MLGNLNAKCAVMFSAPHICHLVLLQRSHGPVVTPVQLLFTLSSGKHTYNALLIDVCKMCSKLAV